MDKKNDYIQLPPMKKDTSADVVSFIWEYMKLPEDVRNKVKSEMDEIHEHCRDSEFQKGMKKSYFILENPITFLIGCSAVDIYTII